MLLGIVETVSEELLKVVIDKFKLYSPFIAGTVFGLIIAYWYHYFVGGKALRKAYDENIASLNRRIDEQKILISERLEKLSAVKKDDKGMLSKIKRFFKQQNK